MKDLQPNAVSAEQYEKDRRTRLHQSEIEHKINGITNSIYKVQSDLLELSILLGDYVERVRDEQ